PLLAHAEPLADKAAIWTFQDESAAVTLSPLTDRFYTNGLRLGWTSPTGAVADVLASLGRFLWGAGQQHVGFGRPIKSIPLPTRRPIRRIRSIVPMPATSLPTYHC